MAPLWLRAQFLLILGSLLPTSGQLLPAGRPDLVAIDAETALYLRLESALWQVIRSGSNQADKVRRIHETHSILFETDFAVRGVHFSRLDVDQLQLSETIAHINNTVTVVLDAYLHDDESRRLRNSSLNFAAYGVNMSYHLDRLFNVTERLDFFNYVAQKAELQSCDINTSTVQSPHQMVYDYYHDLATAQLKAYAIAQLAHMFYAVYNARPSAGADSEQLRRTFLQHSSRARERVRGLLAVAGREVWVCDPDEPGNGRGSAQVTRLLQGYVDNEVNLNEATNDCKKTCPDYQLTRNYRCFNGSHCAANTDVLPESELRCGGEIVGCEFVSSDAEICHSHDPKRRYDSIRYTCGKTMGARTDGCMNARTQATSWTRWLVHCSHCFCLCDEPGPKSDRYFSLRPVLSEVTRNMVITGVALRKINRIFYWQITEHPLLANGMANGSEAAAGSNEEGIARRPLFRLTDPHIADGIDYHTLNYANRSLNLDVLQVPAGSVCTGVRFAVDQGSLRLEVRGTRFNFKTGQLSQLLQDSLWVSNTINEKTAIPLDDLHLPTRALTKSVPDVRPDMYVQFSPSDKWSDVAQSTVPFVDTQLVRPQFVAPLAGVGLYYKGSPGFGGYVAPKILTFDYTAYVNDM